MLYFHAFWFCILRESAPRGSAQVDPLARVMGCYVDKRRCQTELACNMQGTCSDRSSGESGPFRRGAVAGWKSSY